MTAPFNPSIRLVTEIPGPKSRVLLERAQSSTPRGLSRLTPLAVREARGALITDMDGNTFIDFAGGIGALNTGHCEPSVVEAIRDQAERYLHQCFMVTLYEPYVALAEKLNQLTPGEFAKKTILFNSGAEAVENAVKIARTYTGRRGIIAFERSFHGRTLLAVSLTGQSHPYRQGVPSPAPHLYHLPFPYTYRCPDCPEALCGAHSPRALENLLSSLPADEVAGLIVEPVLGEGGFVVPPSGYLQQIKEICDRHGILFIADEVQTGFGRTGTIFAIEHFNVVPDLVVMAKSLSGGTPLSAVTGRADVMDSLTPGGLGGTYGGNPLSCRAALAAVDALESGQLLRRAQEIGESAVDRLTEIGRRFDLIGDVRGIGPMLALELVKDRGTKEPATQETAEVIGVALQRGLILLKAGADGNVIRTLMPLVITDDQLAEGLTVLEESLAEVNKQ